MLKETLEQRYKELVSVAQKSLGEHNALLGRIAEIEHTLATFAEQKLESVEGTLITAAENEMTNIGDKFVATVEAKAGQVIDAEVSKL